MLRSALILALLLSASGALANTSSGYQGTGGVELAKSEDIHMVSEDLRIGLDEIRVSYVFRNLGDHPVETLMVFPLPDLDLAPGLTSSNWSFPRKAADFLGFQLWVDEQPVQAALERRAFHQGAEVTRVLSETGALDLAPWRTGAYDDLVKRMDPAAVERLKGLGLIAQGDDWNNPQWTLRTRYHWTQTFPPGRDVRVRIAYTPFVGTSLLDDMRRMDWREPVGRTIGADTKGAEERYCLDAATKRALAAAQARTGTDRPAFDAKSLDYILTTARNWKGPIGRFHLTVDKGAADNIVSLCWTGLTKTGPTTFESTLTDFVPDQDLRLLVFVRSGAK